MNARGQIILIGGEKGGSGKSTIVTNISVEMSYRKASVIILDTDPQKTSINWIDRRNELIEQSNLHYPKIIGVSKNGNIADIIRNFVTKYDIVLIDASGRDSHSLRTGLTVADKFYCPIRASQADLETLPHICQLIEIAKDFNPKLVSHVMVSCAPTNPLINELLEAQNLLCKFSTYLSLSKTFIKDRKIYRDALLQGMGVVELNNIKAKSEIKNFVNEILG
ncbi:MAG: division plane positioning ATPase MipZ [Rickettsia endosymbiont of Pentastiridius leporinus]